MGRDAARDGTAARVGDATWARHTDIAVLPADHEFDDLGIGGFAADAVAELGESARSEGEDAAAARGALGLLLRLKEGSVA